MYPRITMSLNLMRTMEMAEMPQQYHHIIEFGTGYAIAAYVRATLVCNS